MLWHGWDSVYSMCCYVLGYIDLGPINCLGWLVFWQLLTALTEITLHCSFLKKNSHTRDPHASWKITLVLECRGNVLEFKSVLENYNCLGKVSWKMGKEARKWVNRIKLSSQGVTTLPDMSLSVIRGPRPEWCSLLVVRKYGSLQCHLLYLHHFIFSTISYSETVIF